MSHYTDTYGNDEPRTPSESFVVFGTAFPEQTERDRRAGVSDAGQFVPEWKQEVRDEKGRRRFHGAFTGGFSAGYFNTVGSKEGWTPSSFVSSRSSRVEKREARPEDFMDEEDLEELASARKLVATDEFDILGGTQRELQAKRRQQQEDEARGGVGFLGSTLMDMVAPTKESVGIRLLQKLGWKPGQGIGPRMTRRQRRMTFHQNEEDEEEDEDIDQDVTFAPRDTPIENYTAKTNTFGLGYELEKYVPQVAEMRRLRELQGADAEYDMDDDTQRRAAFGVAQDRRRRQQAGFGLGALEHEDDDDADVYGNTEMKDYHYTLYEDDTEGDFLRREQQRTFTKETTRRHAPESITKTRCSDGRLPIKGFSVSNEPQELGKWYRPPEVPADFNERHAAMQDTTNTASTEPRYNMTSDERGAILGEKPTEPRSVFDYIPSGSKDQLDSVLKFMTHKRPVDPTKLTDFPKITKQQANMALRGFMPFGDNLKKQARYKSYLEDQAGVYGEPKDVLPVPEGLSHEEASKELDEFAKAARIFRPISAMMSGRFTSASENTTTVEQVSFQGGLKTEDQWRKEKEIKEKQEAENQQPEKEKSTEAQAASMKMFGQLTRTVKPFYPARLLCKRFNVRNPHPDHDPSRGNVGHTMAGSKEALSEEKVEDMMRQRGRPKAIEQWANDPALSAVIPKPSERAPSQPDNKEPKETSEPPTAEESSTQSKQDENTAKAAEEDQEKETYERPSMDIFKAIFENSEDEDEEMEERDDDDKVQEPANAESQGMTERQPSLSTTSNSKHRDEDVDMDDQDDVMVGPLPPPAKEEPSVPKFTRASERQSESTSRSLDTKMNVVSESIVVQPFKARERVRRRRHVSVSEEESEEEQEEERRSRHKKKHKKEERRHKKEKKKKEKSKKKHSKHRSSDEDMLDGAVWVEKEVPRPSSSGTSSYSQKRRARATDLW